MGSSTYRDLPSRQAPSGHGHCHPSPVGRFYYGCCEAVHQSWDDIRVLPNLAKVSISQWTDEAFMCETLASLDNARRAAAIAQEQIDRHWHA
jgi:hypothetical protein